MSQPRIQEKLTSSRTNKLFPTPFALLIGPQRAGTTWVDRYLRSRGDVCLPEEVKEIFFFDRNYDRGVDFYTSHFKPTDAHKLTMEITATSFDHYKAPERIHEHFGNHIKLACPLRHPIVRSYSLYLHYLRYGIVQGTLQEAAAQIPQIIESSRYAEHLQRWFDQFGRGNVMVLYQEELENNQAAFVEKLCTGLGIPYIAPNDEVSGKYNITTFSKFGLVARYAQIFADILRKHKLYFIINIAKSIGIKKLIFGEEREEIDEHRIPQADWDWLQEQIGQEIKKYEELIGHKVAYWADIEADYLHD